jgi:hypothetical protein
MIIPPELLALGIIFIFGMIVFLMIRTSRREKMEGDYQLQQLGFSPLETAPLELERRLGDLYDPTGEREIRVWKVYHRRGFEGDLYLFDVGDTHGETSEIGTEIFCLISPQLALPRFSLITLPDFNRDSLIGGLMDKLLNKVMSFAEDRLQLQRIELPDRPSQAERLIVYGQDPAAVSRTLDRAGITRTRTEGLPMQIAGSGDLLTIDFSSDSNFNQPGQDLASRYQTFIEISRRFKE